MKPSIKYQATQIIAAIFIFLFAYTAISKLTAFNGFVFGISRHPFLKSIALPAAWAVLAAELLAAALLFFPSTRRVGFWITAILMSLFTGYIASMLLFSDIIPCSCGGIISSMSWRSHLWLNIGLVLTALWGLRLQYEFNQTKHKSLLQ